MIRTSLLLLFVLAAPLAAGPLKVTTVRARVSQTLAPLTSRVVQGLARAAVRLETDPLHGAAVVFTCRHPRGPVWLRVAAERRRGRVLDIYIAPVTSASAPTRPHAAHTNRQRRSARAVLRRLAPRRHRRFRLTHQAALPNGSREHLYVSRRPRRALAYFPDRALIVVGPHGALRSASLTHVEFTVRRPPPIDRATALRRTGGTLARLHVRHRRPGQPRPVRCVRRRDGWIVLDAVDGATWWER